MRVIIIEQRKHSGVLQAMIHHSLYNTLLRQWHQSMAALHHRDYRLSFQRVRGFDGNRWHKELIDGVHLTSETQWAYLCSLLYVIHQAYHF